MNEHLRRLQSYPKSRLDQRKAEVVARGVRVFDFGTGDPAEPTPEFVRRAVVDAIPDVSEYPAAHGSDDLRGAAAHWLEKRFGVVVDPATEVLATAGSMEAIFHFPMLLVETGSRRDHVVYGEPAYRVFEIGTHFAEATRHAVTLTADDRYLLTPEAIGDEVLARTAVVFLNYPHNPSGQEMPAELFERWVAARDEHGFVIVSDECYCDIYFEDPPRSLLEFGRRGCVAVHTLSKRSGMTGYQTGFLAGDPEVVAALRRFRSAMGVATPVWTQAAAAAAWRDVAHVEERRAVFAQKRSILLEMLEERGHAVYPGTAAMFLWVEVPEGQTDQEYAERLLELGIIVSPGSFFGAEQAGFISRIGSWVLAEACAQARAWQDAGFSDIRMSVNVSVGQNRPIEYHEGAREAGLDLEQTPGLFRRGWVFLHHCGLPGGTLRRRGSQHPWVLPTPGCPASRVSMIAAGRKSKRDATAFEIFSSETTPVPKVVTYTPMGLATPMA